MSVMLVGRVNVKDPKLWQDYVAGVSASLEPFSANNIFRGQKFKDLYGEEPHSSIVLIEFDNRETATKWFNSPAYQALIPIRDHAADAQISLYEL